MNKNGREKLKNALQMLHGAAAIIGSVCDREENCMDNIPENLQGTERFAHMEDAAEQLNDALEHLDEAKEHIQNAICQ